VRSFGTPRPRPVHAFPVPDLPRSVRLVRRHRLFELLRRGTESRVTIVSGPAGSGKTLLAASWLRDGGWPGPVAWVSPERGEWDGALFWGALLDAVRSSGAAPSGSALGSLTPSPRGAAEELVGRLAEGLRDLPAPVLVVLDDLDRLTDREALAALGDLVAASPRLRLLLMARGVHRLRLHRLHLTGELTEIRAADLAFTLAEARELLAAAEVELSAPALERLHEGTEGWAAGLRMAVMALAGRADPERRVAELSASVRNVADDLAGQLLAGRPAPVRRLLLRTSVLDRVNGALAHLLAGRPDGGRILQELEDEAALVTSLDAARSWFRYHPLLADLLRAELRRESPEAIPALNRAAAGWFGERGYVLDAIRHAQAGGDWGHAGELLVEHWFSLYLDGQHATLHALLAAMPVSFVRGDAELAALAAADRLAAAAGDAADAWLELAAQLAQSVPDLRRRRFHATLAVVKLDRARGGGDLEPALERCGAALAPAAGEDWADVLPNEDLRALALMNLGFAELWALRLDDAELHLADGVRLAGRIARPYVELGCLGAWAHVAVLGQEHGAGAGRARKAIELAERLGWSEEPITGVAYLALACALLNEDRLDELEPTLARAAKALGAQPDLEARLVPPFLRGTARHRQARYEELRDRFAVARVSSRGEASDEPLG
jgi:LuxR family transcriptional regulator, maltose regulon positive regulatory protein